MHWFKISLIVFFVIVSFSSVLMIGEERKPTTPKNVAVVLMIYGLIIVGIINYL